LGTQEQIRSLQALQDAAAHAQGQIDREIHNLAYNQMDAVQTGNFECRQTKAVRPCSP
jgi:hypothetical protein